MKSGLNVHNHIRKKTYDYILKNPGLHLNALYKKLNIPKSTMYYHLRYLNSHDFIVTNEDGRYTRYYVKNSLSRTDKKVVNVIRQYIPYRIILFLFLDPNATQIEISRCLNRHPTTISFHMKKLMDLNLVDTTPDGNQIHYSLKNPKYVSDIVIRFSNIFRN